MQSIKCRVRKYCFTNFPHQTEKYNRTPAEYKSLCYRVKMSITALFTRHKTHYKLSSGLVETNP